MTSSFTTATDLLKNAFPTKVVTPDAAAEYESAKAIPWSQTCWTPAAAYVHLSNAHELAQALAIVKQTGSKFTIRTSGHNPNPGFSSGDETTIVLDISKLQSRELGADGVARVGAGNTWGDVYTWLEEQKLCAILGRETQIGIAGFLLGGGYGALPNLHGTGADNIRNFKVLLADGSLVNANASENADLYRALKGGGSNFGIVTRFDLETYPLINLQYTINIYNPEDYVEIIKATIAVQDAMENDPRVGTFTNFNQGFVAVGMVYGDTPAERPAAFELFYNLKSLMMTAAPTTNGTLGSFAEFLGQTGHIAESKKRAIATATTKPSQELYEAAYKTWTETSKTLPDGSVLHYTHQPIGASGVRAGKDRGDNILGLESVAQCWWVFTCEWPKDGDDDAAAGKAVNTMAETVRAVAQEKGLLLDYLPMTFAHASQNVLRSYGADNVKRMQDAAAKYDPEGVFQKLQHNGFLLRNI